MKIFFDFLLNEGVLVFIKTCLDLQKRYGINVTWWKEQRTGDEKTETVVKFLYFYSCVVLGTLIYCFTGNEGSINGCPAFLSGF